MTRIKAQPKSNIPMMLMMFAAVMFGLVILYSVSGPAGYAKSDHDSAFYLKKQIIYTLVGLGVALAISFFPVNFFKHPLVFTGAYIISLGLAVAVRFVGKELNGARRWIMLGPVEVQVSEICKVALVIALAGYREYIIQLRHRGGLRSKTHKKQAWNHAFFDFILPVGACLLVDVFILFQPHFSCFIIIGFIVFMCTLNSGVSWRSWLLGGLTLLLVGIIFVGTYVAVNPNFRKNFEHVYQRFNIFASTSGDENVEVTEDETRQVTNAHNALGSGGMWGRGIGSSRAKYNYVSEAQNDYIFSIYVEETGFVGGAVLIFIYLLMFAMFVTVIIRADSIFTRMLATGCTSFIILQAVLNIAVELQVIPATGVTLPFVSYGGSAQIMLLAAYGFILCVARSGTYTIVKDRPEKLA